MFGRPHHYDCEDCGYSTPHPSRLNKHDRERMREMHDVEWGESDDETQDD